MKTSQRIGIVLLLIVVAGLSGFLGAYIGGSMVSATLKAGATEMATATATP